MLYLFRSLKGRAGRGVEVEESYLYGEGPEGAWRRRHISIRGWTGRGCGGG